MDVVQVQEKKDELENAILTLVDKFEKNTQTVIEDIDLYKYKTTVLGDKHESFLNTISVKVRFKERPHR